MNKFEQNTFGVGVDGQTGPDNPSPASGSAEARDTEGNGMPQERFRGRYAFHLYNQNILKKEASRRRKERSRSTERFLEKNL